MTCCRDDNGKGGMLRTDVLVIGAGQAGLATAYALTKAGLSFLLVDAGEAVGDSWRNRYDGLRLFTPRRISALPGLPLGGDPDGYASKTEFADYLVRYAEQHKFHVMKSIRIVKLTRAGELFEAMSQNGERIVSRKVIVATGAFTVPRMPALSGSLSPAVQQIGVSDFKNAGQIASGTALVVGDGASGRDVAMALMGSHHVLLARGRRRRFFPERLLGRGVWWWLGKLGLLGASSGSFLGRHMRKADPIPARGNDDSSLVTGGVELKPRMVAADGENVSFEDGSSETVQAIIWAVGYVDDFTWVEIDGATDDAGNARHVEGVSQVEGLYFVGRPWQRNRASSLITGVGPDSAFIADRLQMNGL